MKPTTIVAIASTLACCSLAGAAPSYGPDSIAVTCTQLGYKAGTNEYDYCFQSLTKSYASRGLSDTGKPSSPIGVDAVAPATAQPVPVHQFDGVASQPEPKTYYEREARKYTKTYKSDAPPAVQEYWRHRLDLADRVDKGQILLETANELLRVYSDQASREITATLNAEGQRAAQAQARADAAARDSEAREQALQAIVAAQERAAAQQRSQALLIEGLRMMAGTNNAPPPQRQQCTRWFAGQWVTYPC